MGDWVLNHIIPTAVSYQQKLISIAKKYFDIIRDSVDRLELLVDDNDWPLVKYREFLFLR